MLKSILAGLVTAAVITMTPSAQSQAAETYEPNWESLDSRPTPGWFLDAKFGIFIHWGVYAVPAWAPKGRYAEWYWNHMGGPSGEKERDGETWAFHKEHYGADFSYADFVPLFTAELFNPDEWADIFSRAGAKYVVLTSKHHDGFCLFRSKEANRSWGRPWNSVDAGPGRDLLGDLGASVRAKGLKMGFYYSLYEWFNPLYRSDRELFVEKHMIPQFKDVVTRYKPSIIFSDGEWDEPSTFWKSEELLAWLFNETDVKDEVVVNDRWGKNSRHVHGTYFTTEYASGMADASHPWEENRGMGHSYGFNRNEALEDYRTSRELTLMLVDLVSRGGNLLLNVGPTADGRIPVIMQQRLIDIGNWLDINGEAIYGTRTWKKNRQWSEGEVPKVEFGGQYMVKYDINEVTSAPKDGKAVVDAFFTCKGDTLYAIMPRWLGGTFLLKEVEPTENTRVSILGMEELLQWTAADGGIAVELPCAPPQPQTAWTLKVTNIQ